MTRKESDPAAELRTVPPKQFTRRRDELAKSLREAGDEAAARRIKKQRKPSPSLWAANALSRTNPEAVKKLLEAGAALRQTQRRALSGAGGSAELRGAAKRLQQEVRQATTEAIARLREAKESTTAANVDRLRETLLAAAQGDDAVRAQLREGALEDDLSAAGFGTVTPLKLVDADPPKSQEFKKSRKPSAAENKATKQRKAEGRKAQARAKKELALAEHEVDRLDRAARAAEERARGARQAAFEAKQRLEAAKRRSGQAPS